ncbi:FAD binding domain-containing protein [Halodesulfovibrio marinisediminis]|uniref:Carbon-monoxide dehydrogenase medium subunit n=1 Tax=Halodesulfovibrio marinisediminis DSM 17456 TaxID=1121457 RepID=A0A1N6DV32_9BACT|nr:FAD binding domain-containing protein [Halodesulfovibrio marinisediminis]SIN74611.1 carbon-monoxide dehydrogenase medium subunit [Halodesulfovibrio marinisediminis DSM 17456]
MVQDYVFPATVAQAVDILAESQGRARIIAGGTDLVLDMHDGKISADKLVDLRAIDGMQHIAEEDDFISIGANVTHAQVVKSSLLRNHAPGLVDACRKVGSLQIRNVATVVGNVVNGNPAADAAVALACLDAQATVVDQHGTKVVPFDELYAGICLSCIDSCCQVVTHISFPKKKDGEGSAYVRMEQRKALSLPMLNVSAKVRVVNNTFEETQLLMAPVGAGPQHAVTAEEFLRGAEITDENIKQAGKLAREQATFRSSAVRGSKEYRIGVLPVCIERVLRAAIADAQQG